MKAAYHYFSWLRGEWDVMTRREPKKDVSGKTMI